VNRPKCRLPKNIRQTGCQACKPEEVPPISEKSSFSIHLGATKMYQDLKKVYWWHGIKTKIAKFVARCFVCQQVKIEH